MFSSLQLQNFRGYENSQFEFEEGVNIIVGPNASGKTSILEALLVLTGGSSYKGQDTDLIRFGAEWARADARLDDGDTRTVKLVLAPDGKAQKSYEVNEVKKTRFTSALMLPRVFFEPQHMNLLVGEPSGRRQFLDDILTSTNQQFLHASKNYKRALLQRNTLLKKHGSGANPSDLFVWDLRLSELGGAIFAARTQLIDRMASGIEAEYERLSGKKEAVTLRYESSVTGADYTNAFLKKLTENHHKDMLRGYTGCGPHRDDFILEIRGHDARASASRGETRSLLLALKVLELQELERVTEHPPILLLDDVFSELDGRRRLALADTLKDHQAFITTTDADLVIEHFTASAKIIPL